MGEAKESRFHLIKWRCESNRKSIIHGSRFENCRGEKKVNMNKLKSPIKR